MVGPKAYIHLNRLILNYRIIKQHLGDSPIMAVVKANGYGHGAVACAKALEEEGCRFFAVFTIDEALELRQGSIQSDILIFSRMQKDILVEAIDQNFILNLSGLDDFELLNEFYAKSGKSPKFHLKIDTGMTRLGISFEKVGDVLKRLSDNPHLKCEGIYSHYATADEGELDYAEWQLEQFNFVLSLADEMGIDFKYRHFSNSGSVLNLPTSKFDIVRVGMILYGAFPSDEVPMDIDIKPVMEFRGPIVETRRIKAGTKVSYGGIWVANKDTTVGVIQTGFADGFPRQWYDGGYVIYNGNPYPLAGRVCMDQLMVDFDDEDVTVGDEVLLFGENGKDSLHMEEIAQQIQTTPYVLATGIHGRTERIYLK